MDKLEIRGALPEDKDAVLQFCQETWEGGDYVPEVWDMWLNDPCGRLVVGILKNMPIAVAHLTALAPGEAWLEGLRVAPDYRNRGVAKAVAQHCIRVASEIGAVVVRFMTLASNTAACRIAAKLGFRQVASFLLCQADTEEDSPHVLTALEPIHLADVWAFIQQSDIYRSVSGLYCTGWAYHKLTQDKLCGHLEKGEVLALMRRKSPRALAVVTTRPAHQGIAAGYVDGQLEALGKLASALRVLAGKIGHPHVETRLPDLPQLCGAFAQAGYTPSFDEPFLVFELRFGTKPF